MSVCPECLPRASRIAAARGIFTNAERTGIGSLAVMSFVTRSGDQTARDRFRFFPANGELAPGGALW
jgi:hypothetical protein